MAMRGVKRYESRGHDTDTLGVYIVDVQAAKLLAQRVAPACCCERAAEGWLDAGCKLHQPVTSFAVAADWRGTYEPVR